jgi:hypothetical protein
MALNAIDGVMAREYDAFVSELEAALTALAAREHLPVWE